MMEGPNEQTYELLYLEDYHPKLDLAFSESELKPYFKHVFNDQALRSSAPPQGFKGKSIDRNTFIEYVNLPGIVCDRFFQLASEGNKDQRVLETNFINLMI